MGEASFGKQSVSWTEGGGLPRNPQRNRAMAKGAEEKIEGILRDQEHGAAFLAREALVAMKLAADESEADEADSFLKEMASLGVRLVKLRPSMSAPICNGIVRVVDEIWQAGISTEDVRELKEIVCRAMDRLLEASEENVRKTVVEASRIIPERGTVLTHSYSETCLQALSACREKLVKVFVTESRPLFEGRVVAESLRKSGLDVTLLTDAEAGHFMREVQVVLVGADTVLSDGSVVNKMGTYLIALAAKDHAVPFHVACDTWKFRIEAGTPELEEKSASEVVEESLKIKARNVYFDVTPPRLITSILTEDGEVAPPEVSGRSDRWGRVLKRVQELARS